MVSLQHHRVPQLLTILLCWSGLVIFSNSALAGQQLSSVVDSHAQVGRYSVIAVRPTAGQQDLLSVARAITIPSNIKRVGDAPDWLLHDSGYRLADDAVLSEEVVAMFDLPLPAAHRQFEPMPLNAVLGQMVGPAFRIVEDTVHRLIAFERCKDASDPMSIGGTQ